MIRLFLFIEFDNALANWHTLILEGEKFGPAGNWTLGLLFSISGSKDNLN